MLGNYEWNIFFVGLDTEENGYCVSAWASTRYYEDDVCGLRPIVRLKSDVQLVPSEDDTVYDLR